MSPLPICCIRLSLLQHSLCLLDLFNGLLVLPLSKHLICFLKGHNPRSARHHYEQTNKSFCAMVLSADDIQIAKRTPRASLTGSNSPRKTSPQTPHMLLFLDDLQNETDRRNNPARFTYLPWGRSRHELRAHAVNWNGKQSLGTEGQNWFSSM